jgi:hypothetical protein
MNNEKLSHVKTTFSRATLKTMSALALLIACASLSAAQDQPTPSTDRDNPTPIASKVIAGDGVDEKTEYFYTFNAGPGEITITLDVKAEKDTAVSSVDIALFDAKSKKLVSSFANPDHGSSKRAVETVKVRGTQPLLLEVTVSHGVDTFKIKLDGAVKIDATATGAADAGTTPVTAATPPLAGVSTPADSAATTGTAATGSTDSSASSASPTSDATTQTTGAAQTGTQANGATSKVGKANAKLNSASSILSGIITSAGATADTVKNVKKKKPQP